MPTVTDTALADCDTLEDPTILAWLARPLDFAGTELDHLTRELTVFGSFEALATDNGRIDEVGNLYRPTLRADRDPRYAILADAYDAYQAARGCAKRALRGVIAMTEHTTTPAANVNVTVSAERLQMAANAIQRWQDKLAAARLAGNTTSQTMLEDWLFGAKVALGIIGLFDLAELATVADRG